MANETVDRLRHPKEKFYGSMMLIIGPIIWAIVAISMIAALVTNLAVFFTYVGYIVGFGLVTLIAAAVFRAHMYGHYVMIGQSQFPGLHRMVQDGAARLGLDPAPAAFVYNSNGVMNAFARRLFGGRFIFLTSAIVQAETDEQIKFVIGHELGHHAAGHLNFGKNLLKLPAYIVPFLAPAYSRGRELTCDQVGAYLSNDMDACRTALQMLACGCQRLNASLNCEAFEAQDKLVPPFMGWLSLIFARYPRTTQRVIAVSKYFAGPLRDYQPAATTTPIRDAI
jgi:Zn-dependent protease with chaperone function